jgi:5-methylcytosine-specific restriction protein A
VSSETLAVGYELGSIFNKYYDIECLPTNEEFEEDIKAFTQMLVEVELYIGKNRSFEDFYREILNNSFYQALIHDQSIFKEVDDNDETYVYQIEEEMAESPAEEIIEEPTQRKDPVINRGGQENWPRDSKTAAIRLKKTNFYVKLILPIKLLHLEKLENHIWRHII